MASVEGVFPCVVMLRNQLDNGRSDVVGIDGSAGNIGTLIGTKLRILQACPMPKRYVFAKVMRKLLEAN